MKKAILILSIVALMVIMLVGCGTKKNYEDGEAPHVMTVMDSTNGYTIYRHDTTGVWYFCRDAGYGRSVCVMLNPDGTPYVG